MKLSELTEIGRVRKPHGLQGQLKLSLDSYYVNMIGELSALIMKKGDDYLPFFIEEIDLQSQPPIVKFESVNTKEEGARFSGNEVYAISSQLPKIKQNQLALLEGLQVFDEHDHMIGTVTEVMELPSQLVLQIESRHGELMIPFHEDFIIELFPEENRLQLQLPEGLLDIYS